MMRILIALLALTIPAAAQEVQIPRCLPHDVMAATLLEKAKEHPVRIGISTIIPPGGTEMERALVETYASLTGTWTDVKTNMTTGESCITNFGDNFQMRPVPAEERGAGQ